MNLVYFLNNVVSLFVGECVFSHEFLDKPQLVGPLVVHYCVVLLAATKIIEILLSGHGCALKDGVFSVNCPGIPLLAGAR